MLAKISTIMNHSYSRKRVIGLALALLWMAMLPYFLLGNPDVIRSGTTILPGLVTAVASLASLAIAFFVAIYNFKNNHITLQVILFALLFVNIYFIVWAISSDHFVFKIM